MIIKILLLCFGLHFFADFNLQGILAQFKQKEFWKKNAPQKLYETDWAISMLCHSAYWALVTFAPVIYLWRGRGLGLVLLLFANILIHAAVDDLKANARKINLVDDQLLHFMQIVATVIFSALWW